MIYIWGNRNSAKNACLYLKSDLISVPHSEKVGVIVSSSGSADASNMILPISTSKELHIVITNEAFSRTLVQACAYRRIGTNS